MRYEFWIDRGGTFTDCILFDRESKQRKVIKILSSDEAPLQGIRRLLELGDDAPIPPCDIRMGTTVATNALLERTGARTGLVITRGFSDVLEIGDQTRPQLFDLKIRKNVPLTASVHEVSARLDPQGAVLAFPSDDEVKLLAATLAGERLESIALVLLHGYAAPDQEERLRDRILATWPADSVPPPITTSTEAVNRLGLLGRCGTATVDAYLTPLLRTYLGRIASELTSGRLRLMQSSGGLAGPSRFRGPESLLSGPAGGIVAGHRIASYLGSRKLITFDMGGTSTDVALIEGTPSYRYETTISGIPLHAKMMDIHTIAAGGGSECSFDGYGLVVGPRSVGADPGPVCYGKQAQALAAGSERVALTDVNFVLGRIASDHFPFQLDRKQSKRSLDRLAKEISWRTGKSTSAIEVARGFHALATTHMAEAIRKVAVERGIDLRGADLLIFGGAAGQHACDIASSLGLSRIVAHELSGVFSAFGIGQAETTWASQLDGGCLVVGPESEPKLCNLFERLMREGEKALEAEFFEQNPPSYRTLQSVRTLALRYVGADSTISIEYTSPERARIDFDESHMRLFGFSRPEAKVEVVSVRLELRVPNLAPEAEVDHVERGEAHEPQPLRHSEVVFSNGEIRLTPVYELSSLAGTKALSGPALLLDPTGTFVVDEGYTAQLDGALLVIERSAADDAESPLREMDDVAAVQIMAARFMAIAEQMGEALRRSASSTNIRDRLDFSCALFDHRGQLVANAPHIPVHLGAMSESVQAVLERHPSMTPGQAYVTNDPALGGSHLPDITVVTPIFDEAGTLVAFTASRGHHADIGGIAPGSMPADSKTIEEEGVVLSALRLVEAGRFLEDELRGILTGASYPARCPEENIADLKAQLAANQLGARSFHSLCEETSPVFVQDAMSAVRRLAARWMSDALERLPDTPRTFCDELDDGSRIQVTLHKTSGGIHLDFSGSAPQQAGNMNAPRAVTIACVLYVLRVFLDRPLPLNQGCLDPVELTIPAGSILDPSPGSAVAAGNVETSQRIVDVLLGAFDLSAASQGTMNNLSFGNSQFGYYETIAGGAGAGPTFHGASAVHTHMTNTRITDPEVLEARFPVRLHEFSVRRGSGGSGIHRGGDGVIREIEALVPLDLSLITSRRTTRPYGLEGGENGTAGVNWIGTAQVSSSYSGPLAAGQRVRIETPGGGGFGQSLAGLESDPAREGAAGPSSRSDPSSEPR